MSERGSAWPLPLRLLHWLSAVLVPGLLGLGFTMVHLVHDPAQRFELTQSHKSIGLAVFALTLARLGLRAMAMPPTQEPLDHRLALAAKGAQAALYGLLVVMPFSGWLMVSTTPVRVPTTIFGLFELPYPLPPDLFVYRVMRGVHVASAIALAALIGVHVAAALTHALWWRDRTFARMGLIWEPARAARREHLPGRNDFRVSTLIRRRGAEPP